MFIPKKNKTAIYEMLFKEGIMVAHRNLQSPCHTHLDVPNIHVVKVMQSLHARNLVKQQFNWQHYYWSLKNEGIEYLREVLHLPAEIVPATLRRPQRVESSRGTAASARPSQRDGAKSSDDRSGYRRSTAPGHGRSLLHGEGGAKPGETKKGDDAGPGNEQIQFRGGFGKRDGMRAPGFGRGGSDSPGGSPHGSRPVRQ